MGIGKYRDAMFKDDMLPLTENKRKLLPTFPIEF